jgi:hypothetical protein
VYEAQVGPGGRSRNASQKAYHTTRWHWTEHILAKMLNIALHAPVGEKFKAHKACLGIKPTKLIYFGHGFFSVLGIKFRYKPPSMVFSVSPISLKSKQARKPTLITRMDAHQVVHVYKVT